uniref:Yps-3 protein n=2 Tax=Ajellomyces capsulatus TaxID=5037 RepID=Q00950_AJECA|nr:yps-3 [Histoplasma capsulatum]
MLNIKSISTLLLLASSSLLVAARPGEYPTDKDPIDKKPKPKPAPFCGTCNPISGKNHCDITTSCINTGKRFHCACRAGFKASKDNYDIYKQFRLPFKNFEFLVFTPEYTECDILCDDNTKPANELCQEVPLYKHCEHKPRFSCSSLTREVGSYVLGYSDLFFPTILNTLLALFVCNGELVGTAG